MKKKIVNWIRKQMKETKAKGLVLGLSGGIDSSVVSVLAKEAVGKENLLVLILDCHSSKEDLEDAKLIVKKFKLNSKIIDLSKIYDALVKILPKGNRISYVNLKPRLRMLVLYYFANKLNYLVCGTQNRSERQIGYFTKFGDAAADILPIGRLLKKEIRELAKELEIPEYIIEKPPSAGLWPNQTDEREIGITYLELDDILERLENKKRQILPKEKVKRVKLMIKKSEHKRKEPKICYI